MVSSLESLYFYIKKQANIMPDNKGSGFLIARVH
jgi:hypothetical protein